MPLDLNLKAREFARAFKKKAFLDFLKLKMEVSHFFPSGTQLVVL